MLEEARWYPQLRQKSAITSTSEILKFAVSNTVGHKDNTSENNKKFKGLTTDGLNLEDPISREYALKHYQAVRDAMKLATLKLEGRFYNSDSREASDSEDAKDLPERVSRINRKLRRTTLEEKYHDSKTMAKRFLSPLRYSSPYSRANVDININFLDNVESFKEISAAYSTPIPTIRLTERLFTSEERRAKTEPRKKQPQQQQFAATFPIKSGQSSKVFEAKTEIEKKYEYQDLASVMHPARSEADLEKSLAKLSFEDEEVPARNTRALTTEQINRVRTNTEFYADDELNFILESHLPRNTTYINPAVASVSEDFHQALTNFRNGAQRQAVIAIASENHFMGIYINRNEIGDFSITCFDPAVSADWRRPLHDLPAHVVASLNETFPNIEIVATTSVIQTSSTAPIENDHSLIEIHNNHCGAFVACFMTEMANGNARINPDGSGRIQINFAARPAFNPRALVQLHSETRWRDLEDLDREQSYQLGAKIRNHHTEFLSGGRFSEYDNQSDLMSDFFSDWARISRVQKTIARIAADDPSLVQVDFRRDKIGDEEADQIAEALRTNKTVEYINFRGNQIGDYGAASLASALEENSSLLEINFNENLICDRGAKRLARALEKNHTIQYIYFGWNYIRENGAESFLPVLERNPSVNVGFEWSQILDGSEEAEELERKFDAIYERRKLTKAKAQSTADLKPSTTISTPSMQNSLAPNSNIKSSSNSH